jgi:hypothetical protein
MSSEDEGGDNGSGSYYIASDESGVLSFESDSEADSDIGEADASGAFDDADIEQYNQVRYTVWRGSALHTTRIGDKAMPGAFSFILCFLGVIGLGGEGGKGSSTPTRGESPWWLRHVPSLMS